MLAINSSKNKPFWKRIIKKSLKKLTLFFLLNPIPFNRKDYQKQKGPLLFRLQNKFKKIIFLVALSDQVWWCNIKQFLSYSKNYTCKFMEFLSFWIGKLCKGTWKIMKIWISQEQKELFWSNKKHFNHKFLKSNHLVRK